MKNRIWAVCLILSLLLCLVQPITAAPETITISSAEEFVRLAKKCTLDTWSAGKTIELTCDIQFENVSFSPIPSFGGVFNGNGHTISGIQFTKNGSNMGVFRYVQQGGKVQNLHVKGSMVPGGSKSSIGGIAGENSGIIENCSFEGTVQGENIIGGIAGKNKDSGQIISCTARGSINGENLTGGITGENSGFILNCINHADVNTVYEEKEKDLTGLETDAGAIIESRKAEYEEKDIEESVLGNSDAGGITGFSDGIIQGCTNHGNIGYPHVGYNIGGIAGRQAGFVLGCENAGFVQGRKDVGGIVGQMEPYVLLSTSENNLQNVRTELNKLHSMVNRFIADSETLGDNAEQHLNEISKHTNAARNHTENLLNQGEDFIDDNIAEINAETALISNTLDKARYVFDGLEDSADDIKNAMEDISAALDSVELYTPDLRDEAADIQVATNNIGVAAGRIQKAATRAKRAVNDLRNAVSVKNQSKVKNALSELSHAMDDLIEAQKAIYTSVEKIEDLLKNAENLPDALESVNKALNQLKRNLSATVSSLVKISQSLGTIVQNTEIDFSSFRSAADELEKALDYLGSATSVIGTSIADLGEALEQASDKLYDYTEDMSEQINTAKTQLSDGITSLGYATDDLKVSIQELHQIVSDLADEDAMEFVKLGDDFKTESDNLFDALSDISGEIEALRKSVSDGADTLTSDLRTISNQFNVAMNLLLGEVEEIQNKDGLADIFIDISDEDIENAKQGKVAECRNSGKVEGDRNTGGIAGAMAIEYAKDPEDEFEKPNTLNFTYRMKTILQACVNDGEISCKKDCAGGIVGLSEIGTVYTCENYGNIESTGGNYVGGVAGKSSGVIRKNYAKCKLNGKRYVGGIAGKAKNIALCYTIVNVSGEEGFGSVCGECDSREELYKNFFVSSGTGAIDDISYADCAEPISYAALKDIAGIPKRFISFSVTFVADEKTVETQEIKYGDSVARIKYPEIPEKEGHFGNWEAVQAETVTENLVIHCQYQPYITILASDEKNETGKLAMALAEGEFTDKAALHIKESEEKGIENGKVYTLSVQDRNIEKSDSIAVRILNENHDKVKAWEMKNGAWEEVKTTARGKYVRLNVSSPESTICVKYEKRAFAILYWIILILILAAAIIGFVLFKKGKWKFRKKAAV